MTVYVIIEGSPSAAMWEAAVQTPLSARRSLDGEKVLLKFNSSNGIPACFSGHVLYNLADIRTILDGSDWTEEEE